MKNTAEHLTARIMHWVDRYDCGLTGDDLQDRIRHEIESALSRQQAGAAEPVADGHVDGARCAAWSECPKCNPTSATQPVAWMLHDKDGRGEAIMTYEYSPDLAAVNDQHYPKRAPWSLRPLVYYAAPSAPQAPKTQHDADCDAMAYEGHDEDCTCDFDWRAATRQAAPQAEATGLAVELALKNADAKTDWCDASKILAAEVRRLRAAPAAEKPGDDLTGRAEQAAYDLRNRWGLPNHADLIGDLLAALSGDSQDAALLPLVREARDALMAAVIMSNRGPEPKKLDEAMSWRENDLLAAVKIAKAIEHCDAALSAHPKKEATP